MSKSSAKSQGVSGDSDILNRRVFVRMALGGVGACYAAAIGYPIYRYLASPVERATAAAAVTEIELKDVQKQLAPGTAMMFKFGPRPALLIHHKDGEWVALDAVCTHYGCTVQFEADKTRIHCACHDGVYDPRTGKNVSGPPPQPLKPYKVKLVENSIIVSKA
jgi:cytochrome b6-f complex iron-sulfur subunit